MHPGVSGVFASSETSSENHAALIALLRAKRVDNAHVFGWNSIPGLFVLRSNGVLSPYVPALNTSDRATRCPP
ncbi:hypothetical protein ACH4SP_04005 [Streptomyces sp. NPDC021093]|uniref:hypothetical protein n=1 Tax=Streptomyces sp. NPDC021093 TaxID=3365112 RepID=UPI0037A83E1F